MSDSKKENTVLNHKQYDQLLGFFAHCYCVYHEKVKADFGFWAEQLDTHNIPWSVQNTVAVSAEDKGSKHRYLRSILADRHIRVI